MTVKKKIILGVLGICTQCCSWFFKKPQIACTRPYWYRYDIFYSIRTLVGLGPGATWTEYYTAIFPALNTASVAFSAIDGVGPYAMSGTLRR